MNRSATYSVLLTVLLPILVVLGSTTLVAEAQHYTIGFSNASVANPWRAAMVEMMVERAQEYPEVELLITNAQDSSIQQLADVEDLLARGVDLLMVSTTSPNALNPVVGMARDAGIPLVMVNRDTEDKGYDTFVTTNDEMLGALAALELAKHLGLAGQVAIIGGTAGASSAIARTNAINAILDLYPEIQVVADQPADYQQARALTVMENILEAHPNLTGVITHSGAMTMGVLDAIEYAGRLGEITIVSMGSENGKLKALTRGEVAAAVVDPVSIGARALDIAVQILRGEQPPKYVVMDLFVVDATNVDEWVQMDADDGIYVY